MTRAIWILDNLTTTKNDKGFVFLPHLRTLRLVLEDYPGMAPFPVSYMNRMLANLLRARHDSQSALDELVLCGIKSLDHLPKLREMLAVVPRLGVYKSTNEVCVVSTVPCSLLVLTMSYLERRLIYVAGLRAPCK